MSWRRAFLFVLLCGLAWMLRSGTSAVLPPHSQMSADGESVLTSPFSVPTHNLTLSRTACEVIELGHKLHDI